MATYYFSSVKKQMLFGTYYYTCVVLNVKLMRLFSCLQDCSQIWYQRGRVGKEYSINISVIVII